MEEKFIRNRLYHHLACRRTDAYTNLWHIDDLLSHAMAILYPYVRDGIIEKEEKLILLFQAIKTFRKSSKERDFLDSLTELSLIEALKYRWIIKIQNKTEIVSNLFLVDYTDEDGMIHIKPKLLDTYSKLNIPDLGVKYGTKEFFPKHEVITNNEETTNQIAESASCKNLENKETITITTKESKSYPTYIPLSHEEKFFEEMWQTEKLPTSLKVGDFFWQYRITESQYKKIKYGLISLRFEDKNAKFIRRYAFCISLFLAEWFKREYDGFQNERGLSLIGINSQQSRRIWEDSKFPDSYLINSGQNEYLFSIYVLGGFPINYIRRVRRFDSLFKKIWNIQQGEDIDDELLEEISDSFDSNNTVYQESMNKGGSLYAYIETLVDGDVPLALTDKTIEPYRTYCEKLSKGKRECYVSYLSSVWNIYTDGVHEGIDAFVNIKIGAFKNRCYIPYDCVRMWVGSSVPNEFILGLETENGKKSETTIRFSRSGKSFVGWGDTCMLSMMFDIQDDHAIKVMMYSVLDIKRTEGKQIQHSLEFPDKCQFYQTHTPYKWSSLKDTKAHSAVFFNTNKYQVVEGKDFCTIIVPANEESPSWCWTRVYDIVTLKDSEASEEISYNSKQGAMNVFFTKHKGVRYNQFNEVTHVYTLDDDTSRSESVPLILGINGIKRVKLYPFEVNESPKKITGYEVKYKQDSWNYSTFDEQHEPKCGTLQLKIVYKGYKPIIKKCFYVPTTEIFKRQIDHKKIKCLTSDIQIWKPMGEDYVPMSDKESFDNTMYISNDDVVPFRIGTESDYVILDVYRADKCREIFFKDEQLTKKNVSHYTDIPLILRHKFSIRTIDENGVERAETDQAFMFPNIIYSDMQELANTKKIDDKNGICYYLYTFKHNNKIGRHALQISPKQKDNYQFYFWDGEAYDAPIKLNAYFDEERKCLMVPQDRLQNRRQGIIFQSLKEVTPPNYVFPYYPSEVSWKYLVNNRYTNDIIVMAMKIAVQHHVYFSQFYPIHKLFNSFDNGKDLINVVVGYLRTNNKREDFLGMHRMANELCFEWIALPWQHWKNACKTDQDRHLVTRLFRSNPRINSPIEKTSLDLIIERYWKLPKTKFWNFQRRKTIEQKNIENIVLQSMRGIDKDYTFFATRSKSGILSYPTENVKVLNEIYNCDSFYKNLQKEIFDKIK